MLKIFVPKREFWNEQREEFEYISSAELTLEHSLLSLSKWEAKYCKPFLSGKPMTEAEFADYVHCMAIRGPEDELFYHFLPRQISNTIQKYIDTPQTASTIAKQMPKANRGTFVTSELIYYWMTACSIPFSCEKWHLSRLMTLIQICNEENKPKENMSRSAAAQQQKSLNMARRAQAAKKR